MTKGVRWQDIAGDDPKCYFCGVPLVEGNGSIEHLIPTQRGGSDNLSNLVACCKTCNSRKTDKTELEYLHWLAIVGWLIEIEQSSDEKPITGLSITVERCSDPEAVTTFVVMDWVAEAWGYPRVTTQLRQDFLSAGYTIGTISTRTNSGKFLWNLAFLSGPLVSFYSRSKINQLLRD